MKIRLWWFVLITFVCRLEDLLPDVLWMSWHRRG